jgi:hypothetical protein
MMGVTLWIKIHRSQIGQHCGCLAGLNNFGQFRE